MLVNLLRIFILLITLCNASLYADLGQLSPNNLDSTDRLQQLSRTLSQGTYTHPDDLDIPANSQVKVSLRSSGPVDLNNDSLRLKYSDTSADQDALINPSEFRKLGLTPLYSSSDIYYDPKDEYYYEHRYFQNNIVMIRHFDEDLAYFYDLDNIENQAWIAQCDIDRITDKKTCIVYKSNFILVKSSTHGVLISAYNNVSRLRSNHYQYVRIDKNPAFKTTSIFSGNTASNIINQMKAGFLMHTRHTTISSSGAVDNTLSLYGFSAAYESMNIMYARLSN